MLNTATTLAADERGRTPLGACTDRTSVDWMLGAGAGAGVVDVTALKRHFVRAQTTITMHLGYAEDDPMIGHYAAEVQGSEEYLSYTLVIATGPAARLVVIADRDGRPYRDGLLLEDRRTGARGALDASAASQVVLYLAQQHLALGIVAEQIAAAARGSIYPLPAR